MSAYPNQSQRTMASENNDFELYPFQSIWSDQASLPASFADQLVINPTPFDAFPAQQTFAQPGQHQVPIKAEPFRYSKNYFRLQSPSYSPSNSTAHSFDYQNVPVFASTSDGASVQSTISSAMGSPSAQLSNDWTNHHNLNILPGIVNHDSVAQNIFAPPGFDLETIPVVDKGCVDPSLIQPLSPIFFSGASLPDLQAMHRQRTLRHPQEPSPGSSKSAPSGLQNAVGKTTLYAPTQNSQPYLTQQGSRRQSTSSVHSRHSQGSLSSDDAKGQCPMPTCGRLVKDLKAHMLTHQNERPEKCPVSSCEYSRKGFARKYDKNRHTLTHYKGTMVCDFCPGSGSAAEKSFNRADVFKRHLTSVHGVEQAPPNARRKSPGPAETRTAYDAPEASGVCSTCGVTFANAQGLYDHVDDCVLRVVQQTGPSEAVNERLLTSVAEDEDVCETLERHLLPTKIDFGARPTFDRDDDADEDYEETGNEVRAARSGKGSLKSRKTATLGGRPPMAPRSISAQSLGGGGGGDHVSVYGAIGKPNVIRKGLTYSKNGVPLASAASNGGKGNKRRKNYPISWGANPSAMRMKKRVLCVYDGPRRLWKDDMMLDDNHQVRIPLQGMDEGRAWITDLDVQTLNRAEALHNATEEEKGAWDADLDELLQ